MRNARSCSRVSSCFRPTVTLTDDVIALYNALGGAWQETAVTKQRAVDRPVHAVRARCARQRRATQPQEGARRPTFRINKHRVNGSRLV